MPLSRANIQAYTGQLLLGLEYMHSLGIMHRVCYYINCFIENID